ncbi:unnamed protein product [Hydatigera taeniaeformis]|uniref:Capsid protein n=1 Tax=Hydatigena taeniaeformis TaxID=6205 RepID=A0A0R3WUP4_HYDTA|nr:unnamed protein product [Hydatigera taeniaeformis]
MPIIVEGNEELENHTVERVEASMDNTPNGGSGASSTAAVTAANDTFAMVIHHQGTSDIAMVSGHASSFEETEIFVQPVKEESVSNAFYPYAWVRMLNQSAVTISQQIVGL